MNISYSVKTYNNEAVRRMKLVILEQVDSITGKSAFWIQKLQRHNRYFLSEIEEGYSFINSNTEYN